MFRKLERKFGKYAIKGLMKYVTALYILGFVMWIIDNEFYANYLMLDIDAVMSGQVWRVITFIIQPPLENLLLEAFSLYVYYIIGNALEKAWGSFRFNLYYFSGILFTGLAIVAIYFYTKLTLGFGISYPLTLTNLNLSLFLGFAATFPEMRFYFMFFLPVKAKVLGFIYGGIMVWDIADAYRSGKTYGTIVLISIVVS